MSMRLKGLLMDQYQSLVERSYLLGSDPVVLENVPCEMTFESAQGFIDHENEQHNYLPVFHLMGYITSISGDFPYHISSIYFDDLDKAHLAKDCLYYPSPDELAHMIKTGKYFSKHFDIPDILGRNTYSFPARVNLTIVPPSDPEAYEQNVMTGTLDGEDIDRLNLPIVYVGILGSGIDRKTDKLLDYYGIDLDPDFQMFALTAESSGYTDPPLMNYIPEPAILEEVQQMDMSEYYITEEDEKQMLDTGRSRSEEEFAVSEPNLEDYPSVDMETVIIAKADRAIERRLEGQKAAQKERQEEAGLVSENVLDGDQAEGSVSNDDNLLDLGDDDIKKASGPDVPEEHKEIHSDAYVPEAEDTEGLLDLEDVQAMDVADLEDLNGADVSDTDAQTKLDEARSKEQIKNAGISMIETTETTGSGDQTHQSRREGLPLPSIADSSDDTLELG